MSFTYGASDYWMPLDMPCLTNSQFHGMCCGMHWAPPPSYETTCWASEIHSLRAKSLLDLLTLVVFSLLTFSFIIIERTAFRLAVPCLYSLHNYNVVKKSCFHHCIAFVVLSAFLLVGSLEQERQRTPRKWSSTWPTLLAPPTPTMLARNSSGGPACHSPQRQD